MARRRRGGRLSSRGRCVHVGVEAGADVQVGVELDAEKIAKFEATMLTGFRVVACPGDDDDDKDMVDASHFKSYTRSPWSRNRLEGRWL